MKTAQKTIEYPSIFNDVLGPVMRGPSSSHCAASLRIGRICKDLMGGEIKSAKMYYDPNGSLATTHKSQGSDMGLYSGFMGFETDDERLIEYEAELFARQIKVEVNIISYGAEHPNTYKIHLENDHVSHEVIALSTGGGMIEIISIDDVELKMKGDYYEVLLFMNVNDNNLIEELETFDDIEFILDHNDIIQIKSQSNRIFEHIKKLENTKFIRETSFINPVVPVLARKDLKVPFILCAEMEAISNENSFWEMALKYEAQRGNISEEEVRTRMKSLISVMKNAIEAGLKGTSFEDRILGSQSPMFKENNEKGSLLDGGILNKIVMYVSAIMEVKSSMGVIVAAPTAGSCGACPGTLIAAADELKSTEDELINAFLSAGLIGVFIDDQATFAAEVGGCQAECGAGSGMAAAGLVTLMGGTMQQCLAAASIALQNSFGMVCDPIANRVEAPCLGKNVMAASNAFSCANMALSGYDPLIPLDEVIQKMDEVGKSISHELRCTALGGLATTKTAKEIEERLKFKSC